MQNVLPKCSTRFKELCEGTKVDCSAQDGLVSRAV